MTLRDGPEDGRLFDPERHSPARPEVILQLPESNARAFWVASTLGRFLRNDGGSEQLRSSKEAAGTLITRRRLPVVLEVLGVSERYWRRLVADWEHRYIAHRCGPGTVFLFAHFLLSECPACHTELEVDHVPPAVKAKPRGRPFRGAVGSGKTAQMVPKDGAVSSGTPDQLVPLSGTNASHLPTGLLPRDEVGLGGSEPSDLPSDGGVHKRRRGVRSGEGAR